MFMKIIFFFKMWFFEIAKEFYFNLYYLHAIDRIEIQITNIVVLEFIGYQNNMDFN